MVRVFRGMRYRILGVVSIALLVVAARGFFVAVGPDPTSDFMTFRASGEALLRGGDLYAVIPPQTVPNLNPPYTALLFLLPAAVPIPVALALWELFVVACLAAAAVIVSRTLQLPFRIVAPLIAVLHPTLIAVAIGQMGIPLMLLLTAAWAADRRRAAQLAGVAIGLAVALKMFVAVLLVSLCIRRQWRTLAWSAVAVAVAVSIGFLVAGVDGYRGWLLALRAPHNIGFPLNASLLGLVHRHVADPARVEAIWVIGAGALGLATIALLWRVRDDVDRAWGVALAAALLLSPLGWIYYLPILAPPLLALWTRGSQPALIALGMLMVPVTPFHGLAGEWLTITLIVSMIVAARSPHTRILTNDAPSENAAHAAELVPRAAGPR